MKANSGACASAAARFRPADTRKPGNDKTLAPAAAAIASVESVDPLSATMSSTGPECALASRIDARQAPRVAAALRAGTITEIQGAVIVGWQPAPSTQCRALRGPPRRPTNGAWSPSHAPPRRAGGVSRDRPTMREAPPPIPQADSL